MRTQGTEGKLHCGAETSEGSRDTARIVQPELKWAELRTCDPNSQGPTSADSKVKPIEYHYPSYPSGSSTDADLADFWRLTALDLTTKDGQGSG